MNSQHHSSSLSAKDNFDRRRRENVKIATLHRLDPPIQEQQKTIQGSFGNHPHDRIHQEAIARIYVEQATVYETKGNWSKAILACKNALELDFHNADAYKILGNILYRQGKEAEALGVYAKALTLNPNSAKVYANLGTLYADRQDWQQALDYYQQAAIIDPNLPGTYRNLARVWEQLGETEKALDSLCRAIDLDPSILTPEDYFSFGREVYQQGKVKEASIIFAHGVRVKPQAEAELAQLVQMFEELEEWQQAVFYYHQLISIPDNRGRCKLSSQNSQKPIAKLLSGSKNNSTNSKVIAKNTRKNIPLLPQNVAQKLLPKINSNQTQPDSAVAWNNLGSTYAQQQQWKKAIGCYEEALQLDSQFGKSYRNLARVYQKIGEELKATLYWYEALQIEPNSVKPETLFGLAKKLVFYQQREKGIFCLQRLIKLDPDFQPAIAMLEKIQSKNCGTLKEQL